MCANQWLTTTMNRANETIELRCLWGVNDVVYLKTITDGQDWLAKEQDPQLAIKLLQNGCNIFDSEMLIKQSEYFSTATVNSLIISVIVGLKMKFNHLTGNAVVNTVTLAYRIK